MRAPDPLGLSRVVRPAGALPQAAEVLDPSLPAGPDELVVDVAHLNVDAASFRQLAAEAGGDPAKVAARIETIVRARGKLHNPVTGSGGMLVGRVREVGPQSPHAGTLAPGDEVATLVSLTLTPLALEAVERVDLATDRADVRGHAIVFASGPVARLPPDLPRTLALAVLAACAAPAHARRLVRPGHEVLVLGAGKSGALVAAQAKALGATVTAIDLDGAAAERLRAAGLADRAFAADASRATEVQRLVAGATGGALADVVFACTSAPGAESAALLSVRDRGTVVWFSMATSFSAVALGAEGLGKDVDLLVGSGYVHGHAALALELVRRDDRLQALLEARYVRS